jgi:2-hydroxycyclohexanecarboxyl-CoA dehydrogenase
MTARERSVAIITGGAGAIGAAVCRRLAANGWQVAVIDVDPDAAAQFAAGLSGEGHRGIGLDVADTAAVGGAIDTVETEVGPVEALINVAGWDRFMPFVETTPEFWQRVIAVNYVRMLNTVHAALPRIIERQRGRIVSVASDAARVGSSLESIYAGAKGAVISFSKSVRGRRMPCSGARALLQPAVTHQTRLLPLRAPTFLSRRCARPVSSSQPRPAENVYESCTRTALP